MWPDFMVSTEVTALAFRFEPPCAKNTSKVV
jgi:hypothetical protein